MAHKVGIYYDEQGLRRIMKGNPIEQLEQQIMARKLAQVQAEFLEYFGFQGAFELKAVATNSRRGRITYRIVASNARTTAALKRQPNWLSKFL